MVNKNRLGLISIAIFNQFTTSETARTFGPQSTLTLPSTLSQQNPHTQSTTLIDLLSNSTNHSKLLHLIQISRLVPFINLLNSSTLFAPTNQAINSSPQIRTFLDLPTPLHDNLQTQLRQTILYHLLNFTLPEEISSQSPQLLDSLLLPTIPTDDYGRPRTGLLGHHTQKFRIISREKAIFIGVDEAGQGGIQLPPRDQFQIGTNAFLVSIDSILTLPPSLKHLIRSIPSISTYASILSDTFLEKLDLIPHLTVFCPHNDAWNQIGSIELAYLKSNYSAADSLKLFRQATADNVFNSEGIGYSESLRLELENRQDASLLLPSLDGKFLAIGVDQNSKRLTVNGSEIIQPDILASNGVLHITPNLLVSSVDNPLEMNAEKYLLALNCTQFVMLFQQAHLSSTYLTNRYSEKSYTILAVPDDVLRLTPSRNQIGLHSHQISSANDRWNKLSTKEPEGLVDSLKYHVIEGKYMTNDLNDGMLLKTELDLQPNSQFKQRMPVSVSNSDRKSGSSSPSKQSDSPIIGFGGASVVRGDPVQIGNTVIYIISQIIEPPSDLLQVALSDIRFSTGVASIFSAKLDQELKSISPLTYLMPTNKAFADLGLIMDYLLLEKSKPDLVQVLKFHALKEVIYLNEIKIGNNQRYPTLEGTELYINKLDQKNVTIHSPTVGGVALNGESKDSEVINSRDVLIENGSMEFINQVELPSGVEIGIRKLMLGAKASTMLELIESSELSWILDTGTPEHKKNMTSHPNYLSRPDSQIELARSYTILCPSDQAFTSLNLTYYLADPARLDALVRQHIIPTYPSLSTLPTSTGQEETDLPKPPEPFKPLYIDDGIVYHTLLSKKDGGTSDYGDVSFRFNSNPKSNKDEEDGGQNKYESKWLVGIKGARGLDGSQDSARLINFGRASPQIIPSNDRTLHDTISFNGGVFLLDTVLEPYVPSFWQSIGKYILLWLFIIGVLTVIGFICWKVWSFYRIKFSLFSSLGDLLLCTDFYASVLRSRLPPTGYQFIEPMEE